LPPDVLTSGGRVNHPTLRLNDGFDRTSPELAGAVKKLQELLNKDGFGLVVDGRFGRDTDRAVKSFQREHELDDDGVVGRFTWAALLDAEPSYTTTLAPDDAGMLAELIQAVPFKTAIDAAAERHELPVCIIGAIGSRESGWGLRLKPQGSSGTGDFIPRPYPTRFRKDRLRPDGRGFGRGLMQIDFDSHEFARSGPWRDPAANIDYGARVLAANRDFLKPTTALKGDRLLRASIAAYNCGTSNVLRAIRDGLDVDFYTSGRNYSADVLNRAGWFCGQGWEWATHPAQRIS